MSEYSQPLSTCSRTTDFSFCFNNSAFSDAVLVLLTLRSKGASITWRLASSVAQLFVSAVEVGATTLTATIPIGGVVDPWYGKTLGSLGRTVVSGLSPKDGQQVAISTVYQVNSALLAASSPYLRQLIQHPPSLQHLVPGLSAVAARHRQRKLVTVMIQPHHVAAAEQVIRFIFTNDIALTSAQQALDALLVAEQLQVPDCAEVCQHYLEDCSMDWPVALTLVHLQHKHQQEQQHLRQQQWQQQQQLGNSLHKSSSGSSIASTRRPGQHSSLHSRNSLGSGLLRGRGSSSSSSSLNAVAPPLPVPSESVYLQALLLRAQDFLVHQFEDLELVLASAEGRQRLLLLPYDALRAILGHDRLRVASENTALLAAAGWLQANAAHVGSLLLNHSSSSGSSSNGLMRHGSKGDDGQMPSVYNSALYTSSSSGDAAPAAAANGSSDHVQQIGAAPPAVASGQPAQQQPPGSSQPAPPTASGAGSLLLDLCQVLRLCQCSYTYILHVLPQLPLFRDELHLVAELQFEVLRFRAAGKLRQRRLAAEATAAAAAAAAANPGLTGHHLAGLEQQQQQQQQQLVQAARPPVGGGSDSSADLPAAAVHVPWAAVRAAGPLSASGAAGQGWRSGCTLDAALLQCQLRPESARSCCDIMFSFDPQLLAGPEQKASGRAGSGVGAGGSTGGGSGSSGVDLMQRLLGLSPQQQAEATVMSEDHYFAGYVWNMVVAADGFVGVSWRVVLPGGVDVPLSGTHLQPAAMVDAAAASRGSGGTGSTRLFGPDCAGFRSAEVAVTFNITSSGLSRAQRNNSSSGSLATATIPTPAADLGSSSGGGAGNGAGVDAAVVKPGSRGSDQSLPASTGSSKGAQVPGLQQGGVLSASPVKGKVVGRAYSEVQFVPAQCAWGFPDFAGAAGWEALKGPDGKVALRCQLKHRE